MKSLRQIISGQPPLLLLDAASGRIQVGIFEGLGRVRWAGSNEEAGVGLFRCVESLGVDLAAVRGFAFAASPGSILGIRTAAMALRTWCAIAPRPVFAYNALAVVAQALGRPELGVIADARRERWHFCRQGQEVRRVPAAELSGPLAMPEGFRHWSAVPSGVERVPYDLAEILPRVADAPLFFESTDSPDAMLPEEPQYATWSPQIHRAP